MSNVTTTLLMLTFGGTVLALLLVLAFLGWIIAERILL